MSDQLKENRLKELVQVAAVAVANIEIELQGHDDIRHSGLDAAIELVVGERARQFDKWGPQTQRPYYRLMVLMEEVGEYADEIDVPAELGNQAQSIAQIVQTIKHAGSLAQKWVDRQIDRNNEG